MDRGEENQEIHLAERNEILNLNFPPGIARQLTGLMRKAPWILPAALSFFLVSCASTSAFYTGVENNIADGNYGAALDQVRANRPAYGDKSTVLYNLDVGLLFHYAGVPDSSNIYFFAAEKEIGELFTRSVTLAAASMLHNVLPYEGEDFEKVLVNVFLALNYAQKGEPDDALVEARKVDEKLREYARQYEGKNKYQEDAFIRYVTGVLYESRGEVNDAFIAYRKAFETYRVYTKEYGTPAPSFLLDDLVRTATLMSFDDEAASYRAMGGRAYTSGGVPSGSVIVLVYSGRGPVKQEVRPKVSIPDEKAVIHTFQVALPKFVARHQAGRRYSVDVRQGEGVTPMMATTEVAEDVTAIAARTLEDRLSLIYLKSGGRALLKFLAAEKAKSELSKNSDDKVRNFLGSLAVDLTVAVTEQADVRTWRTLPAEFQIARLNIAPGDYTVRVSSSDGKYILPGEPVNVRAGKSTFLIVDDVR
jgi:hypothetical protein